MPEENAFPSSADHEESGGQTFQDDQDESIVLDSKSLTDFDLHRLLGIDYQPLAAEAAEPVANHGHESYVDGLMTPADEVAKALSQQGGILSLFGLTLLSEAVAKELRANPEIHLPEKFR